MSKARGSGWEEPPSARGQMQWQGGATPCLRPGAVPRRSHPMSKEQWLCGCGRAQRSYPTLKVKKGGGEEIPLSKVRSSSCALLEQLWRDTPRPR